MAYIDATNKGWDKYDERSGMIIITFGETGGKDSIDQYVCDNMRSFIGDEMNKISLIMAPATHSESGEKVDVDNFFVINDVVIQYYPNPDKDKTHYFFYQKGYEDTYKGKYGEWNNEQIVWYQD